MDHLYFKSFSGFGFGGFFNYSVPVSDANDVYSDLKVSGISTGLVVGYLFEPSGPIQFNLGLRYEHIFGTMGSYMFSLSISHAVTFGRRE